MEREWIGEFEEGENGQSFEAVRRGDQENCKGLLGFQNGGAEAKAW